MSCGISSHRQPVLRTYRMPLITSRSLLRGRPNRFRLGNNRLILFHWASPKSDRYALRGSECTGNSIGGCHQLDIFHDGIHDFTPKFAIFSTFEMTSMSFFGPTLTEFQA